VFSLGPGPTRAAGGLVALGDDSTDLLEVLVLCGYYDVATPFNGIEHTVSHMSLEPAIRKNISFAYYEAGHMMYIEKKSREKVHKDVSAFIINSASRSERATRAQ